ncbi:nuclear transport factor 2 family protein [Spirosoma sp. KCTC 42546]|uniref:YybH family protein n=1 Tax=Spirosoma sp. KCTC 42546 TaxID=2520506 RepID=UPI0011580433|nr:nuclear transport factor 2 family protein [Spirosoma sp. KCTC 42546]QDK77710.1 nuclear transport factor 2 family protein [Spirosoma sp. KCTC 42546]
MLHIYWLFTAILWIGSTQTNPRSAQTDYENLIAAERAFAQLALDQGVKKAFVENLDEQSVVFQNNRFLPGKTTYQQLPDGSGKLTWRPAYAEISASGTLGYTTGPFEFRPRSLDEEPVSYGQFTSVWHKTATGQWKVLIDFGCTLSKPNQPDFILQIPTQVSSKSTLLLDTSVVSRALRKTELAFIQTAQTKSLREAYQSVLPTSDSIRLLREGSSSSVGLTAKKIAVASDQKVDYQLVRIISSPAGDLGYSYGYATFGNSRQGYLRIWRKRHNRWQLAHEVLGVKLT